MSDESLELLKRLTAAAERQAIALETLATSIASWDSVYERRDTHEQIHSVRMTATIFDRTERR